jgi:sugar/nucleoside kinase (ribokinase family)
VRPAHDVVVAGHICLDLIPRLRGTPALEPGGLTVVGPAVVSTGGAVANTGLALHRLGTPVAMMGKIGSDPFGRVVLDLLAQRDPSLGEGMLVSDAEATSYTIVFNPPGRDRSFLHCPAANDTFSAADVRYDLLQGARLFHFGYPPLMRKMYEDAGAELCRMFRSVHDEGPATSLDLCEPDADSDAGRVDWEELLAHTLPYVDLVHPSIDELLFMLDRPAHAARQAGAIVADVVDYPRLVELGDRLLAMGPAVVAIKLGELGLYVRTTSAADRLQSFCERIGLSAGRWLDQEVLCPCFAPRSIAGTTGAGDCTIAGFIAAMLRDEDPSAAATSAAAVGAFSVESVDATSLIPPWPEVAARIRGGWPRLPSLARDGRV